MYSGCTLEVGLPTLIHPVRVLFYIGNSRGAQEKEEKQESNLELACLLP